jgi:hypothetical protein
MDVKSLGIYIHIWGVGMGMGMDGHEHEHGELKEAHCTDQPTTKDILLSPWTLMMMRASNNGVRGTKNLFPTRPPPRASKP